MDETGADHRIGHDWSDLAAAAAACQITPFTYWKNLVQKPNFCTKHLCLLIQKYPKALNISENIYNIANRI